MFVEVLLDQTINTPLDYKVPEGMQISFGTRVKAPLKNKSCLGTIVKIKETSPQNALPLLEIIQEECILSEEQYQLAQFISHYYCTPLQKIIKMMLPLGVRKNTQKKKTHYATLKISKKKAAELAATLRSKAPQQAALLDLFLKDPSKKPLKQCQNRSALEALKKKGALEITEESDTFSPLQEAEFFPVKPKQLTPEQLQAKEKIEKTIEAHQFQVHLLFGITGSGKSEVYFQLIQKALSLHKGVLYLVPEIALTEQLIDKLKTRFPHQIALLHHRLTPGERNQEWLSLARGEKSICLGARSSIFSPIKNIGLIIVDEEHEGAYKQTEEMPCYNARDIAIVRAKINQSCCILGSATPSLESYTHALTGKYTLTTLKSRPHSIILPSVQIIDMTKEFDKAKGWTLFSEPLLSEIQKNLKKGEQSILFLNRRGWHTSLFCIPCQKGIECPHCSCQMTFHKGDLAFTCHLCSYTTHPPKQCPKCYSETVKYRGIGTEQVEKALYALFPEAKILRMDADTTRHKHTHEKIMKAFGTGKADILIGTQMVIKGLTFPQVSLVGILNGDQTLHIPEFRSSEITFQQLTQVAGRAGRGLIQGQVLLQTAMPHHPVIQLASTQNYAKFYEEEIKSRKILHFPPFYKFAKIIVKSKQEHIAKTTAQSLQHHTLKHLPPSIEIFPITPCSIYKIKDFYRVQFLLRGLSLKPLLDWIERLGPPFFNQKKAHVKIDIDPLTITS